MFYISKNVLPSDLCQRLMLIGKNESNEIISIGYSKPRNLQQQNLLTEFLQHKMFAIYETWGAYEQHLLNWAALMRPGIVQRSTCWKWFFETSKLCSAFKLTSAVLTEMESEFCSALLLISEIGKSLRRILHRLQFCVQQQLSTFTGHFWLHRKWSEDSKKHTQIVQDVSAGLLYFDR